MWRCLTARLWFAPKTCAVVQMTMDRPDIIFGRLSLTFNFAFMVNHPVRFFKTLTAPSLVSVVYRRLYDWFLIAPLIDYLQYLSRNKNTTPPWSQQHINIAISKLCLCRIKILWSLSEMTSIDETSANRLLKNFTSLLQATKRTMCKFFDFHGLWLNNRRAILHPLSQ